MTSGSLLVLLGFVFMLCAGVWGCQLPAGARGKFDVPDSEGTQLTISTRRIDVTHTSREGEMSMVCQDQKDDLYLFSAKQDGFKEQFSCSRLEVKEDGTVLLSKLKSTDPGDEKRDWLDDWAASCAAATPQNTATLVKAAK